ncbi:hypothetical protein BP5796_03733 [Coleophoma crateriformis]|uniref:FAD-binding PCMH-type domain-containing protein n=1 Tax=Coleophoma crateriformis TaxID=565419 RepID=A0A3D8SI10_9HELO|nr:hypothetical protein BP5796_03733 [Coleophoma crateriformis]
MVSWTLFTAVPVLLSLFFFSRQVPDFDLQSPQCTALSLLLGNKVSYAGNAVFANSVASYFSAQSASVVPQCIVKATSSSDVATAVKVLSFLQRISSDYCQFAIRSGGHMHWAGAASIDRGVVLDLSSLNRVSVREDRTIASVEPGAKWGEVYMQLDAMGLSVTGGRVFDAGVGGGISFFSARYGFACDNVANYELVLASGEILNVNQDSHPDLFRSLKGGTNNFGVITRFDLKTFPLGKMFGGFMFSEASNLPQVYDHFAEFAASKNYDENAAWIQSFTFGEDYGFVSPSSLEYTQEDPDPEVFRAFRALEPAPVYDTLRLTNLSDLAFEMSAHTWSSSTFKVNRDLMDDAVQIFNSTLSQYIDASGLVSSLVMQPIPAAISSKSATSGGNSLGIDPAEGPLVLCLLTTTHFLEGDDDRIAVAHLEFEDRLESAAKKLDAHHPFQYLNYASQYQDPIRSYGEASNQNMEATSIKYDPRGLFQKCVPGGFKLFGKKREYVAKN